MTSPFTSQFSLSNTSDSYDTDLSASMKRALSIAFKLLQSSEAKVQLYSEFLKKFKPDITIESIQSILDKVAERGFDVKFEILKNALMMCSPFPNSLDPQLLRPVMYFDVFLVSNDRGNRQTYLHVIKILHEYAHMLIPSILNLCSEGSSTNKFSTPIHIGQVNKTPGDCGSGLEDIVIGGKVTPHRNYLKQPYRQMLTLRKIPYQELPPSLKGNMICYHIKDEYIDHILNVLENWEYGELPSLYIPEDGLQLEVSYIAGSIEEARKLIFGTTNTVSNAISSRMSKRQRPVNTKNSNNDAIEDLDLESFKESFIHHGDEVVDIEDDEEQVLDDNIGSITGGSFNAWELKMMQKGYKF